MKKIKDFIDENKAASVMALLTIIAFIIGIIIICFGAKDRKVIKEKKVLQENTYTMYFKTDSIIKIIFKENYYKCGNKVCSDYTERVVNQELINDKATSIYSNINIKNKDLAEAIGIILTEAKSSNNQPESIELISNWKNHYTEDEFKELLKKQINEDIHIPIIFEFHEELDEEDIIANATKKSYIITFDSTFGSAVASQTVFENETALVPENPTREGYDFVDWQYNNRTFNFDTKITKDYTLKAKWKRKPTVSTTSTTTTTKKTTTKVTTKVTPTEAPNTGSDIETPNTPEPEKPTTPENNDDATNKPSDTGNDNGNDEENE